jgi:ubiquinone/menaquinone biosynthesis C-methylase UbiE
MEAQSLSVKRAEVEFHNFASFGEPERAIATYLAENVRRSGIIQANRDFIGEMSPFLEIGSAAGHSSYMLTNEFGADGFALDLSADALRYGRVLLERWDLEKAPVRIAGDALHLPFADNSLRMVMAFQMLSQFMDIDAVFKEVHRVLAPGGVFLFAEEPLKRLLSLRLYRCPYYDTMQPWERKLADWGLLGYLVRDVIGAEQEESFGIRQNHTMGLKEWHSLVTRHFAEHRYQLFVPERGWGERVMKRLAVRLDRHGSEWRAARLLGGTLAAICKKSGDVPVADAPLERRLRCPDCRSALRRDSQETLHCTACRYSAPLEGGVYNLLASSMRTELYPGDRPDVIDFCLPGHASHLLEGWYELEGVFGNKYRWIGKRATARLDRVAPGPLTLRIRGHAATPLQLAVKVNGKPAGTWPLSRVGLFILEAPLPDAQSYDVEVTANQTWRAPNDDRELSVTLSMFRLIAQEDE